MPRIARFVAPSVPGHISQGWSASQFVFRTRAARLVYVALRREEATFTELQFLAYCLMPNQIHLIAVPPGLFSGYPVASHSWQVRSVPQSPPAFSVATIARTNSAPIQFTIRQGPREFTRHHRTTAAGRAGCRWQVKALHKSTGSRANNYHWALSASMTI